MCSATIGLDNESPLYLTCTKGVNTYFYLRNSFTKKEDEPVAEQHNYEFTIMDMIMIMVNRTRKKMTNWVIDI